MNVKIAQTRSRFCSQRVSSERLQESERWGFVVTAVQVNEQLEWRAQCGMAVVIDLGEWVLGAKAQVGGSAEESRRFKC